MHPRAALTRTNCGALLCHPLTGQYRMLSQSDALGLALCEGTNTFAKICPAMAELYRIPRQTVEVELRGLFADCLRESIVCALPVPLPHPAHDYKPFIFTPEDRPDAIHPCELSTLGLELSEGCVLSCVYCFADSAAGGGRASLMPTSLALRLLREGREIGAMHLILGGGEPLIHPDMALIVEQAIDLGYLDIQVSTKATSVSRETARALRQAGLTQIQVSLDSWSPEEVDHLTGHPGAYGKALRGLLHLIEQNLDISVRPTLTRVNVDSLPHLVESLSRWGIRSFRPTIMTAIGRGVKDLMPTLEQLTRLEESVAKLQERTDLTIRLGVVRVGNPEQCAGGRLSLYVQARGRVVPCDTIATLAGEREVLGNVLEQSMSEIWTGERIRAFRRPRVKHPICLECDRLLLCAGGCRVQALVAGGDMDQPDPRCRKVHPELVDGALMAV